MAIHPLYNAGVEVGQKACADQIKSLQDEIEELRGLLQSTRPFVEYAVEHAAVERDVDLLQSIDARLGTG